MKQYRVKNSQGKFHREGKVVQSYKDKMDAKDERKKLNGQDKEGNEQFNTGWRLAPYEVPV